MRAGLATASDWPPVLTFFVVGGFTAATVAVVVLFRRLRDAARGARPSGKGRR